MNAAWPPGGRLFLNQTDQLEPQIHLETIMFTITFTIYYNSPQHWFSFYYFLDTELT